MVLNDISNKEINNICRYNQNLINTIQNKINIYKKAYIILTRHKCQSYKNTVNQTQIELEVIKEILGAMNIDLVIDYDKYKITFHDLNNDFKIEIKADLRYKNK